ncbi:MAG: hypothetical protein ACRDBL_11380 [Rhabdaerophilum sp.]
MDEKRFTALGQEWIARFDFNATCAIEDETGESFYTVVSPYLVQLDEQERKDPEKLLTVLKGIKSTTTRLVLFHALSYEHDVTIEKVGEIIQSMGRSEAQKLVTWAILRGLDYDTSKMEEGEGNAKVQTPNRRQRKAAASNG